MTALAQYETLEATALWRETLATQRREVIVSFGDASLMIRNAQDEPLSHWSLAAITRQNPGAEPAVFTPNPEANETLEIADPLMVQAIEKITLAIDKKRPHPGRLRLVVFASLLCLIGGLSIFWLPGVLIRHATSVVPSEVRTEIGHRLIKEINTLAGSTCDTALGRRALSELRTRLLPNTRGELHLIVSGLAKSIALPGNIFLLSHTLVEDFEDPSVLAGYVLLEKVNALQTDPLAAFLEQAGAGESLRLLTTGHLSDIAFQNHAQFLLTKTVALPDENLLLAEFISAEFSSTPFAYAFDFSGETTLHLIEADPYRNHAFTPLLRDDVWVGLQGICGG